MTLAQVLEDPALRAAVVRDGVAVIEAEVSGKPGLSGVAIRAGFRTMKRVRPGVVAHALHVLLPEFAVQVDPHFASARERSVRQGRDELVLFVADAQRIAEDLLQVTDARAGRAKSRTLVKVYRTLRPQAVKQVAAAMPAIGALCQRHLPKED